MNGFYARNNGTLIFADKELISVNHDNQFNQRSIPFFDWLKYKKGQPQGLAPTKGCI